MVQIKPTIQLCLMVLFLGKFVQAKNELQRVDVMSIEDVAKAVCENEDNNKQFISAFSLLSEIRDYITLSSDPKLVDCWSKHGNSIKLAIRLINASHKNICDDKKISLIEEFHHKYISMNPRDSGDRELNQRAAPQILKTFFILYVRRLHRICKDNLNLHLQDLTRANEMVSGMSSRKDHVPFDDILDGFSQSFLFELSVDKQKYIFLLWSLVEEIAYESRDKVDFTKYVDLAKDLKLNQVYRVTAKMSNTEAIQALQNHCRQHLHPIYSRTVLPVIRLVDLGYYLSDIQTIPQRWYKATQLCETILPIRFVADTSLKAGQVVLVPKEEVEQDDDIGYPALEPMPNSYMNMMHPDFLPWLVRKSETDQLWKDIKTRKDVIKRYMSKISSKALAVANQKQGSFYLASKRSEGGGKHDFTEALGESMTELSEPTGAEKRQEKLHKFGRGLLSGMKKAAHYAGLVLVAPLKVVGCILAIIVPDFSSDNNPLFIGATTGHGGGGGSSMPVTLMAVPAIG